jgi:5-methylcytosine-specific restriction endonuclease McrBC GTP-binding regulatory subunit McrB
MTGNDLYNAFKENGFTYSRAQIFNLFISLKTKPFVILSGVSGSGKSKIIELLAAILTESNQARYELIAVKPNWRDSRFIFGFHNLITGEYNTTPILNLIIKAAEDKSNPYFLILDEMNLAKVEQYFADFLSIIESRRYIAGDIPEEFLRSSFRFPQGTQLSEAIVMACLYRNPNNDYLPISDYRENVFSEIWKDQFFGGKNENWTPQFRTELNQKDSLTGEPSRLAGKLFEANPTIQGSYRLRPIESLNEALTLELNSIKNKYDHIVNSNLSIFQQKIQLHSQSILPSSKEMPSYTSGSSLIFSNNKFYIPSEIEIPSNLFVIGTVNMDETTHVFSPKVLDRANVIEMNEIDLFSITGKLIHKSKDFLLSETYFFSNDVPKLEISLATVADTKKFSVSYPEHFNTLFEINEILKNVNRHFGYRVYNEISKYILNIIEYSSPANIDLALDYQIVQKILPKFHGSLEQLYNPLMAIFSLCYRELPQHLSSKKVFDENDYHQSISLIESSGLSLDSIFKYPSSAKKLKFMLNDLLLEGYTSFIQ